MNLQSVNHYNHNALLKDTQYSTSALNIVAFNFKFKLDLSRYSAHFLPTHEQIYRPEFKYKIGSLMGTTRAVATDT